MRHHCILVFGIVSVTLFSLAGVVSAAEGGMSPGQSLGIDFCAKGGTPGAGREKGFVVVEADGSGISAIDTTGASLPGVTLSVSGIGGVMHEKTIGFGKAGVGDYSGTPFSDRSFNDGVFMHPEHILEVAVIGLNPKFGYDVRVLGTGPVSQNNPVRISSGRRTVTTTYNAMRPGNTAKPVTFSGVATDTVGTLKIWIQSGGFCAANAIHVTAVAQRAEPLLSIAQGPPRRPHYVPADKNLSEQWLRALTARGERKVYRGQELLTIGMPCGGIAAGQLYVRGDGTLARWWMFNENNITDFRRKDPHTGYRTFRPPSRFEHGLAISATVEGGEPVTLELSQEGFKDIGFIGEYPIATILYEKPAEANFPLTVQGEVFSPIIPLNTRESATPGTILRYTLTNPTDKPVAVAVGSWMQHMAMPHAGDSEFAQRRSRPAKSDKVSGIVMDIHSTNLKPTADQKGVPVTDPGFGDMSLVALDADAIASADWGSKSAFLASLAAPAKATSKEQCFPMSSKRCATVTSRLSLAPGENRTIGFLVTWYFPNFAMSRRSTPTEVGRMYTNWYSSSTDVANFLATNYDRLYHETCEYRDALYLDTNLPYWFVQRSAMSSCNLASNTVEWWKNGRFYSMEGIGFCLGTCGHVWNYSQSPSRLFPELERSVRIDQDYNPEYGFNETGRINFRGYRHDSESFGVWGYIPDAQSGYVLKAYREHLMSADSQFLDELWPRIKRATEYLIERDGRHGPTNGILEDLQHLTDSLGWGPNTFTGSLYLAALRASEEMATLQDDEAFAKTCHALYEQGRAWTLANLWNGEYFIHKYSPAPKGALPNDSTGRSYGNGCLSDQVFGQNWAHQLGLGYIYPRDRVDAALASVYKYNWTPDVATVYERMTRRFILLANEGEPGMVGITYPLGAPPANRIGQNDDPWTGYEYQAASGMIWEGLLTEGLSIAYGVHQRYNGTRHNPWNEIEGGDHYSRSMSAWGMLLAASGWVYDGPAGLIGFAPRMQPDDFRSFFTAAEGWGTISQKRGAEEQRNSIRVRWGVLRLTKMVFELPDEKVLRDVLVKCADSDLDCQVTTHSNQVTLDLPQACVLERGQTIEVTMSW